MASNSIDINSATVAQFEQLNGVGRHKAEAIVKHRKTLGGFQSISDLGKVPGVGYSVLEWNRRNLICSPYKRNVRGRRNYTDKDRRQPVGKSDSIAGPNCSGPAAGLRRSVERRGNKPLPLNAVRKLGRTAPRKEKDVPKDLTKESPKTSQGCGPSGPSTSRDSSDSVNKSQSRDGGLVKTSGDDTRDDGEEEEEEACVGGVDVLVNNNGEDEEEEEENDGEGARILRDEDQAGGREDVLGELSDEDEGVEEEEGEEGMEDVESVVMEDCSVQEDDEEDNISVSGMSISESVCSGIPTPRSRIPVPISGSYSNSLMKRKMHHHAEEFVHYQGGKRVKLKDCSSPQTTYSNLKGPLRKSMQQLHRQRIPSKEHPPTGLSEWLKQFQEWGNAERLMAVDQLICLCEPTQVRHMMQVIEPQFQRDFISLLPKELALYVLSFLEPKDLLQAAQTCRYWRVLAEDNLLWREKCKEEAIDESLVFGNNRLRRRQPSPKSPWKALYMRQHQIEQNWRHGSLRPPKLLKGHDDHVITCLEFYGTRVVSGSDDNTLKVWSALTGKCLRTLVGHTGGVWSSQMHSNTIISGSTDRTLKVWNADTGQCIHTLYGHTSTVRCMHLCGNKVVSGSRDATLRVWNVESGQCLHVLMGHVAAVRCVQYDGRRVVSGAYDYMVKVWDPETETCLHTLQGHTNRVYSLQFDGVHIVSGSLDTSIRVWDVETGNCLHTLIGHQSLTSGLELKDNILVSGNADSTVKVWDITTGQCLQTLQGSNKHQSAVTCLQFNKKFVITSSDDGTVKIWDLKTGDFLRNLVTLESGGSGGVVWRVRCSNTKLVCAVGSRNGTEETKLLVLDFDVEEKKEKLPMIERS